MEECNAMSSYVKKKATCAIIMNVKYNQGWVWDGWSTKDFRYFTGFTLFRGIFGLLVTY